MIAKLQTPAPDAPNASDAPRAASATADASVVPLMPRLARRMSKMTTSAVREILKVAERPEVLSFAGGLPAPELFPIDAIAEAHDEVLARDGRAALQYSTTEGFLPLREWVCDRLAKRGVRATPEQVLITSGSQQGIDLVGRVLLDPGDLVAVENPSYLAALQCFGGYEARFLGLGSDDDGMQVEMLERATAVPKLIYVVADFHNPKGTTLSLERRERLVRYAADHRVPILEDDPYGELRFRNQENPPPALAALDEAGLVVRLGTFSKTLAPGLRLGWLVGSKELVRQLAIAKQASDLHSATFSQRAVASLLARFNYDGHIARIRAAYGERCQAMLGALERHLPEGTRWTKPDGGLFIWVQLPGGLRGEDLLEDALKERVAFVPGAPFFAESPRHDFIRLNFSNRPPELIEEGMSRLGRAVGKRLAR
jgi:2-aminoadipate transaminase